MATLRITGTVGQVKLASLEQVRLAFTRAANAGARGEEGVFAIVEREDGAFVQLQGAEVEVRVGDEHDRLDLGMLAAQVAERLRHGQDPWGDLPHGSLEQGRAAARSAYWRSNWIGTLVTVLVLTGLLVALWLYVR